MTFGDDIQPGLLVEQQVIALGPVLKDFTGSAPEERMLDLLAHFADPRRHLARLAGSGQGVPIASVRLRAPVLRPGQPLAAVGNLNENRQRETQPINWFFKSPESLCDPDDTVILPPHEARIFHHEAELTVVIGKHVHDVPPTQGAMDAIFGYTCGCDVSGRGLGKPGQTKPHGQAVRHVQAARAVDHQRGRDRRPPAL